MRESAETVLLHTRHGVDIHGCYFLKDLYLCSMLSAPYTLGIVGRELGK